jgi:hypothetical protein
LFTTAERMKKPFASIGFAGAIALLVAGCTAGTEPAPVAAPAPVVAVPVVAACSTEDLGPWGDSVALRDVTDELGTYCQTTIDPDSAALVYDASIVDMASLEEHGFTEEDVKRLQADAVKFFAEETLDSSLLDRGNAVNFAAWADANQEKFAPGFYSFDWENENERNLVYAGELTPTARDGGARLHDSKIELVSVRALLGQSAVPLLLFDFNSTVNYRMSDQSAIAWMLYTGYGSSAEQLLAEETFLKLDDGEDNVVSVTAAHTLAYTKEDKIAGNLFDFVATEAAFAIR